MDESQEPKAPKAAITLIQDAVNKEGISLRHLAEKAGVDVSFLSRILSGERGLPPDPVLNKIAETLNIPAAQLFLAAGRVPTGLKPTLEKPRVFQLLRATEDLDEDAFKSLLLSAQRLRRKHERAKEKGK